MPLTFEQSAELQQAADCLTRSDSSFNDWPDAAGAVSTAVYLDASKSMRGFLDPKFANVKKTDYRNVLDALFVTLKPNAAFAFGSGITPIQPKLSTVISEDFYAASDTELEDAVSIVAADTLLVNTHIIVGDGRRGSPKTAFMQYETIRSAALEWINRGGYFMVGATWAPFYPVAGDPSGCRASADTAPDSTTCPLYTFAFVRKNDARAIAAILAMVFDNLFVTPLPPLGRRKFTVEGLEADGLTIDRAFATVPVPRANVAKITKSSNAQGSTAARGRLAVKLLDPVDEIPINKLMNQTTVRVHTRAFSVDQDWTAVSASAPVRVVPETSTIEVTSYGAAIPSFYRLTLMSVRPKWVGDFAAGNITEGNKTFGLDRLFTPFVQADKAVARLYLFVH